ncbi:hypothetical protein CPT_Sansa93 [Caulobacter phage Sansa]|uniref:Uncharacterized protein n=1 Tax=Caulobacter phage Sansa TaxID=1675600 RepID=A0A0K1LLV7_9CAUD|nr:hypothetical protein HOR07_gp093 [Caulobacter phage Sansa]AKU43497.1 hypothetical protein CPT_Sansa93 [Caulobacter phage Sansa]
MARSSSISNLAIIILFGALAIAFYGLVVLPGREEQDRRAVAARGYQVDEIHHAMVFCAKNRDGFRWRAGNVTGKVCVGNFMPAGITID